MIYSNEMWLVKVFRFGGSGGGRGGGGGVQAWSRWDSNDVFTQPCNGGSYTGILDLIYIY